MENTTELLLRLVRSVITSAPVADLEPLDDQTLQQLYALAEKHEMAHLLADGLKRAGQFPAGELGAKLRKQLLAAVYSDESKARELEQIQQCLARQEIDYMPLKGSVLRHFYPETWMRTRCDIDLLVRPKDMDRARTALEALGYAFKCRTPHDISLYSPQGIHLELHFSLLDDQEGLSLPLLEQVWDHAHPQQEGSFHYVMEDAMFYYYHLAHIAKHVRCAGCGLRPFVDLWLLDQLETADGPGREKLLQAGGLEAFANTASRLAASWFSDGIVKDALCEKLETYIVSGGIYGSLSNVGNQWESSPNQVLLQRIFRPYRHMVAYYPSLKKHPWLYPVYHLIRWRDLLRRTSVAERIRVWKGQKRVYDAQHHQVQTFLEELGLWK